jgi:hypothetical protein
MSKLPARVALAVKILIMMALVFAILPGDHPRTVSD